MESPSLYYNTRFELPRCIFLIFLKTWGWCKLIALCCQVLVQLNNQEYHFLLANRWPRVPERRQVLKNSSLRVSPNTLQCLWVPTSHSIIPSFTKYMPGKFPQEPHSLRSTFYSGRLQRWRESTQVTHRNEDFEKRSQSYILFLNVYFWNKGEELGNQWD